ncbi:MAG: bis(5'-nucleosyl)-tetraphosphatase (symmetrical) YqeK [Senegalia sp. (in: firmicutes)]|uniref:bis(5'-nucleosyl)-tetraphosphatase (symmetrical) YqeK n=1 Tax=Senegalia sp. (in: firmicutes) TaxID=1924098 RepID=UPI003F9E521C
MEISKIKEILKNEIDEERYKHTIRVVDMAIKLAKTYNVDEKKAELAALLHDSAKYKDREVLLEKANEFDIILDVILKNNHHLIHPYLGAKIAELKYNIVDEDILNAIKYHTTGRCNMTMLEKIIFMADFIEPNRSFLGIDHIRDLAFKNIDKSMVLAMDNTLKYIIDRGFLIHPDTIETRNSLILKNENNI